MKKLVCLLLAILVCFLVIAEDFYSEEYQRIVREGVKWVNEKVIVNHGDTTSFYYIYEIQGKQQVDPEYSEPDEGYFDVCHYYTGSQIEPDNDSIISILNESPGYICCYNNWPYQKICDENRNMIEWGNITIYDLTIIYWFPYYSPSAWLSNYLNYQTEPQILNTDNLVIAEPIVVEGKLCQRRLAYVNEDGDTLAYVVEGIGFDSRDMGDLLTPFTRKPDPNADYQEWCGLSHVVKDGQIIYKGMRWREGVITGIDEVVTDKSPRLLDPNYYNLMGQSVGKELPTAPGIYIHQGKKIIVR